MAKRKGPARDKKLAREWDKLLKELALDVYELLHPLTPALSPCVRGEGVGNHKGCPYGGDATQS